MEVADKTSQRLLVSQDMLKNVKYDDGVEHLTQDEEVVVENVVKTKKYFAAVDSVQSTA
eukprot:CAMPEP_0194316830 /NCGR_PEP_ID=MMETSP0171-20130528/13602_1 /TAXON_ID=218684 /ORGANISM="Corethron pennatum, Strain L29A3" /LENGTH=58 /DNA_ID=CAMNT_0039073211 /DNA_START=766 /DNA_END=942 /DNA_ORIENTATION=+